MRQFLISNRCFQEKEKKKGKRFWLTKLQTGTKARGSQSSRFVGSKRLTLPEDCAFHNRSVFHNKLLIEWLPLAHNGSRLHGQKMERFGPPFHTGFIVPEWFTVHHQLRSSNNTSSYIFLFWLWEKRGKGKEDREERRRKRDGERGIEKWKHGIGDKESATRTWRRGGKQVKELKWHKNWK